MRFLKMITIAMAVMIVVGTTVVVVVIVRRLGTPAAATAPIDVLLDEPAGTQIAGIATVGDRLAVHLEGGGAGRVVLLDARTGAVTGRIVVRAGGE
jgi:Family of unknown function (DUF6476)